MAYQRFMVDWIDGQIKVQTKKGSRDFIKKFYTPGNFIYGNPEYLDETRKLPDYVHQKVWELYRLNQDI